MNKQHLFQISGKVVKILPVSSNVYFDRFQCIIIEPSYQRFPHKYEVRFLGEDISKVDALKEGDYVGASVYLDAMEIQGHWFNIMFATDIEVLEVGVPSILAIDPERDLTLQWTGCGGVGYLRCVDCGKYEKVLSFIHGCDSSMTGLQCQHCGAFYTKSRSWDDYFIWGSKDKCPECGALQESDVRDKDLFCPHCRSKRLLYNMIFIS